MKVQFCWKCLTSTSDYVTTWFSAGRRFHECRDAQSCYARQSVAGMEPASVYPTLNPQS